MTRSQKQRIALARALLNDPKVIILDELTTDMDELGKRAVGKAMEQVMADRTTLLISVQDDFLSKCDRLYVLSDEERRLVGEGLADLSDSVEASGGSGLDVGLGLVRLDPQEWLACGDRGADAIFPDPVGRGLRRADFQ